MWESHEFKLQNFITALDDKQINGQVYVMNDL
jgi:hypothetical protein